MTKAKVDFIESAIQAVIISALIFLAFIIFIAFGEPLQ
jgi:hypothetical protein